ncbi:unnamed protein product [Parnassius mnemosyne]|uniref:PiggyBac transposable element-derived protein domain-containing protein n=1 Tax=Parnassius mnemosyne TaxID=213953 RepID=A0AAV1LEM9_9NEOP
MDKKKRKLLTEKSLSVIVENMSDLSDLSDYDSEDDPCYENSIHSPSSSILNQPDDCLIERRLEQIFGLENNLDEHTVEVEPMHAAHTGLLSVLDDQPTTATKDIVSNANSINSLSEQDTSNNPLQVQELYTQEPDSRYSVEQTIDISETISSNNPAPEQAVIIQRSDNIFLEDIDINDILENDEQEPQLHSVRDRSQLRDWKIKDLTHDVPIFEKRFKANTSHKTQPLAVFKRFFPDKLILIITEQTNRNACQKNCTNWKPVTEQDIRAYLGILIMMGLNPLPDLRVILVFRSFLL